jgi:hypothetical protein
VHEARDGCGQTPDHSVVVLGSGSSVQGIILGPGNRQFDACKIIAKQFLGLRAGDIHIFPQLTSAMAISAAMKARAVVAAYSVMAIGPAPVDGIPASCNIRLMPLPHPRQYERI